MMRSIERNPVNRPPTFFSPKALIPLIGVAVFIVSCSSDNAALPPPTTVNISGTLDDAGAPVDGVTARALTVASGTVDNEEASTMSNAMGQYTIVFPLNAAGYLELSKTGFATLNTRIGSFDMNTAGVDFGMIQEIGAESAIDTAFGGMMFDLPDKAWLAINVEDAVGNEVDGATITVVPAPAGGGTLNCDGTLTGGNVTSANPPCNPPRAGSMFLAYFDADTQVDITVSGSAEIVAAPLRMGELTIVGVDL
jgi:hypothetical protein